MKTAPGSPRYDPSPPVALLTEEAIKAALETCAREPIHIPGSIQPHGVLLAMTRTGIILQVSANSAHYLGSAPEALLGQPIGSLLGLVQTEQLFQNSHYRELQPIRSTHFTIDTPIGRRSFDAVTHFSGEHFILELEPQLESSHGQDFAFFYDGLRDFSIALREAADLDMLYRHVARSIYELTGFDSVKLYRFDPDWNGEVVAEAKSDRAHSYLGLHFPASDIPAQARELYTKNYLRLIADIGYQPVPILSREVGVLLDLSLSILRSVSPVHVQYLANMGMSASMSVSIIQNQQLWGLIACHHLDPRHVPYRVRMIAELMGHIFSAQLSSLEELQRQEKTQKRSLLIDSLSTGLELHHQPEHLLSGLYATALDALSATGVAGVNGRRVTTRHGETPESEAIAAIIEWLSRHHPNQVFHTDDLAALWQGIEGLSSLSGGMLATPIGRQGAGYLLWFRPEIRSVVKWAGKPEKQIEQTSAGYRLSPRGSFALWQETMSSRAQPWQDDDIALAQTIVNIFIESEKIAAMQASAAKSEFLANMSHELRTPMNAVIGIADILSRSNPLTREQQEFVSTLQLSSHTLLELINDLLDIAKIESGSMTMEAAPFNFCEIIEEVRSLMAVRAAEKRLHLNITYPKKQECHFLGDALRLRQVILNLVSNAIKFTDHGFVNLSMRVQPAGEEGRRVVQLDVSDTGIGMSDTQVTSIFDKFVQADASISRRYGGTGLGLSITKHLVDLMGGEISVVSKQGMGSKFTLLLPLLAHDVPQETVPCAEPATRLPGGQTRGKVLLTEDYEGNIMVALTYLQDLGYDVIVARNGREALEKIAREEFDIVLMDVQMPEMDGYTATREIRKNSVIPIIGMTAHALTGDREKCLAAGMDDYISKPFTLEELRDKLERYIARYRQR